MSKSWYYEHNGEKAGPIPWHVIDGLAEGGRLDASTRIWKSGWPEWRRLGDVLREREAEGRSPKHSLKQAKSASSRVATDDSEKNVGKVILLSAGAMLGVVALCIGLWALINSGSGRGAGPRLHGDGADEGGMAKLVRAAPDLDEFPTDQDKMDEARRLAGELDDVENRIIEMIEEGIKAEASIAQMTIDHDSAEPLETGSARNADGTVKETVAKELRRRIQIRRRNRNLGGVPLHQLARKQQDFKSAQSDLNMLTRRNQSLEKRLSELNAWSSVSFVLVNGQLSVVGVSENVKDKTLTVVIKASGTEAVQALMVVRNSGIPRIDRDRALSREVHQDVKEGGVVDVSLAKRIRRYWRSHRFVHGDSADESRQFVHFRDLRTGSTRLGVFLGFEGAELVFQPVGSEIERVTREFVDRETALVGDGKTLLDSVSAGEFLDYCVLNIGAKLGSHSMRQQEGETEAGEDETAQRSLSYYVRVAIHVDVDAFRDDIDLYRRAVARKSSNKNETNPPSVSASVKRLNAFTSFLTGMAGWSQTEAERFLLNVTKEPDLRKAASFLEDELYARLVRLGIPVLEREELSALMLERSRFRGNAQARRQAGMANATHLLIVELKASQTGDAAYHLSVRVVDVDNGVVEWAAEGERFASQSQLDRVFHLSKAGRLAVVSVPRHVADAGRGIALPRLSRERSRNGLVTFLAYVEPSTKATEWSVRCVDDGAVFVIAKSSVRRLKFVGTGLQIPREFALRYAMSTVRAALLPPAAPVVAIDKNVAIVGMGMQQGVRRGDQMFLFRPNSDVTAGMGVHLHLPVRMSVVNVSANQCRAVVAETGFEEWWADSRIQTNDVAVVKRNRRLVIGVEQCRMVDPDVAVLTRLNFRNPVVRARLIAETTQAASRLQAFIESDMLSNYLAVTTVEDRQLGGEDPKKPSNAYSHLLEGKITLSPLMATGQGSASSPVFRVELSIRSSETQRQIRRIEFDWDGSTQ